MFCDLPAKPFLMIRHGESTANADGSVAGLVDVPLTEKGRQQAIAARACFLALKNKPAQIVHSHLIRAKETARLINEGTALPMFEEPALCERSFGDWAFERWDRYQPLMEAGVPPPHGETREAFTDRALGALGRRLAQFETLTLFVTHGGIFSALDYAFRCADAELANVENCTLYSFQPKAAAQGLPWHVTRFGLDAQGTLTAAPLSSGSIHAA